MSQVLWLRYKPPGSQDARNFEFLQWRLIFVGAQLGNSLKSLFRHLEFWDGFRILKKISTPLFRGNKILHRCSVETEFYTAVPWKQNSTPLFRGNKILHRCSVETKFYTAVTWKQKFYTPVPWKQNSTPLFRGNKILHRCSVETKFYTVVPWKQNSTPLFRGNKILHLCSGETKFSPSSSKMDGCWF